MVVVDDLHDVSPVSCCLTSPPTSSAQAEVNNFLKHWKEDIQPKLVALLSALSKTPLATAILSCQIFSYRPVLEKNVQFLQAEEACLLAGGLEEFHRHCHVDGIALDAIGGGPMGKVWENGDVQVVQYPSSLPISAYPMDRFPREALPLLGEVVFLPVYDGVVNSPTPGIVGVVECMLNRQVTVRLFFELLSCAPCMAMDLSLVFLTLLMSTACSTCCRQTWWWQR